MRRLLFLVILIQFSFSVASLGQQPNSPCVKQKIAFYNKAAFDDEKGVRRLYEAHEAFDKEMISDPGPNPTAAQIENRKDFYQSRRHEVIDPVLQNIDRSIEIFEAAQGFRLFDGVDLEEKGLLLAIDKKFDLTQQLIKYLNQPTRNQEAIPQLNVEPSRIGKMNFNRFLDPQRGIKNFDPLKSPDFSETYKRLDSYLDRYVVNNGFSVIFDSSKSLDPDIEKLACEDATDDFIVEFNELSGTNN